MRKKADKKVKKTPELAKKTVVEGPAKKTKIRIIGIGGGGGNIISEIASKIRGASFVAANTDSQALRAIGKKAALFHFGENFTHGLGTGMNPQVAETAAEAEKGKIEKILQGQDFVILVATLGGGAGSGALPVFAKISRSLGNLTLGIFTLPFKFEGEKKMEIASTALEKLKSKVDAYTVVPNEKIFQIVDKATPLVKAFSSINKILAKNLEGLIETVFEPGLINIDFADLRTILSGQGRLAYLNTVEVPKSESSAKETVEKVLSSPLYSYNIRGAKGVLLNIAGEKELGLAQVSQISQTISGLANSEAKIIFGISQGKKYQNLVKTTLLATGCKITNEKLEKPIKKEKKKAGKPPARSPKSKVSKIRPAAAPPQAVIQKIEVRKNALDVRRDIQDQEAEILEQEKAWEPPAFLRPKK